MFEKHWVCKSPCFLHLHILFWNYIIIFAAKILAYLSLNTLSTFVFSLYMIIYFMILQGFITNIFTLIFNDLIIIFLNSKLTPPINYFAISWYTPCIVFSYLILKVVFYFVVNIVHILLHCMLFRAQEFSLKVSFKPSLTAFQLSLYYYLNLILVHINL